MQKKFENNQSPDYIKQNEAPPEAINEINKFRAKASLFYSAADDVYVQSVG